MQAPVVSVVREPAFSPSFSPPTPMVVPTNPRSFLQRKKPPNLPGGFIPCFCAKCRCRLGVTACGLFAALSRTVKVAERATADSE